MNKQIRVLHVFANLNRGGAESRTIELYRAVNKEKVQFDFVVHSENGYFEEEILSMGGRIHRLKKPSLQNMWLYKKQWENLLKENKDYDIIHGHFTSVASIYMKIAKKNNIKTRIVHSRSSNVNSLTKKIIIKLINFKINNNITHMFAVSRNAALFYFGKKNYNNVEILKNAIDVKKYTFDLQKRIFYRKQLNLSDNFVIGHVGRFHVAKNHLFLIDIFIEILKIKSNSILILVGDGEEKKNIEDKLISLNIYDKVIFTGAIENVSEQLQVMDVFVFPSLYEGLPGSVLEAQAAGLQCFISENITDEVCATDLVNLISLIQTPKYWANKILAKKDVERKNMSNELINSGFDVDQLAENLEGFYLDTIKNN